MTAATPGVRPKAWACTIRRRVMGAESAGLARGGARALDDEALDRRRRACRMRCFVASRRRHTRFDCDWSSDVCSSDLQHQHHTGKNPPKRPRRLLHLHLLARKVRHLTPVGRLAHQMFLEGPTNPVQTDAPYGPHVSWRPFRVFPCLLSKQLRCAPRLQITATPC